jgi:L-fucose mutarotase/ribose pyranase (RbsD/FucU family)
MKRMNEVFDLPLVGELNCGEPFLADSDFYFASFDDELSYADGKGLERATHAAHAINNVDALADALEACMNTMAYTATIDQKAMERYSNAIAALAAYRGEK